MIIHPITLRAANAFVKLHHRHHKPRRGHKFSVALHADETLVGVAIAGRPVSQVIQKREPCTLEVNRTCTDGTRNANSMLYGAIWRAAKAMGYTRCITYTQEGESGASLRGAGWVKVKDLAARGSFAEDSVKRRAGRADDTGGVARQLWEIRA